MVNNQKLYDFQTNQNLLRKRAKNSTASSSDLVKYSKICFQDFDLHVTRKRKAGENGDDECNNRGAEEDEAPGVGTGSQWNTAERDALKRLIL